MLQSHSCCNINVGLQRVRNTRILVTMAAPSETSLLALTTAAVFVAFATWWWRYRSKKQENNNPPTSWHPVGEISAITLYPLKSGCGLTLEEAECTDLGLQCSLTGLKLRDRFFIVHDETGEFKTARTYPKMVLIKLTADKNNMMVLEAPEMPLLKFHPPETVKDARVTMCKMWNADMVKTADCGHEVAFWLSKYILGKESGVRLGYFLDSSFIRRPANRDLKKYYPIRNEDMGVYSDISTYMLMTEASVEDLKTRLPEHLQKVSAKQFRPNFVVKGTEPYAEDDWEWIKIGENAIFRNVKPCTRCVFTTIDPETGVMEPKREPLKTLKEYRQLKDEASIKLGATSPRFGLNLGIYQTGNVHLGDKVYVGK